MTARPDPMAAVDDEGAGQTALWWCQWLGGRKLVQFLPDCDMREGQLELHLCSNGDFLQRRADGSVINGIPEQRNGCVASGAWSIRVDPEQVFVRLEYDDRGPVERRLKRVGEGVIMDGEYWRVTPSDVCGTEKS